MTTEIFLSVLIMGMFTLKKMIKICVVWFSGFLWHFNRRVRDHNSMVV